MNDTPFPPPGFDPSGILNSPAEKIEGPYGWAGAGASARLSEDEKAAAQDNSDISHQVGASYQRLGAGIMAGGGIIGAGSSWTGIGAVVGGGIAGIGAGIFILGTVADFHGYVSELTAEDPPRSDYKEKTGADFSPLIAELADAGDGSYYFQAATHGLRLLQKNINALGALEFYQGAFEDGDAGWVEFHRKAFVAHSNSARRLGLETAIGHKALRSAMQKDFSKKDFKKLDAALQSQYREIEDLTRIWGTGLAETIKSHAGPHARYIVNEPSLNKSDSASKLLDQIDKSADRLIISLSKSPEYVLR